MLEFVTDEELGLYGCGETKELAEKDLEEHFWYYYHYYKNTAYKDLTDKGAELKRLFLQRRSPCDKDVL